MIHVLLIRHPFQPFHDLIRASALPGQTIREWLHEHFGPDFQEFDRPTVCQHNGEMLVRKEWDRELNPGDVLAFVTLSALVWWFDVRPPG